MEVDLISANKVEGGWPKQKDGSPDLRKVLKNLVNRIMGQVEAGDLNYSAGLSGLTTLPGGYPSAPDDLVVRIQVVKGREGIHKVVGTLVSVGELELAGDVAAMEFLDGNDRTRAEHKTIPAMTRAVQKLRERDKEPVEENDLNE